MTHAQKDIRGNWKMEDSIDLVANRVLKVSTHKTSSGWLVTTASVHVKEGSFLTHRMYHDFSQRMESSSVRCTEKNVTAQHAACMAKINEIHSAITVHYIAKGECVPA
jgi:hypothetical protein